MRALAPALLVVALLAACGGSTSTTGPTTAAPTGPSATAAAATPAAPASVAANAGGSAHAIITVDGTKYTVTGGRCIDGGSVGIDVAVGSTDIQATVDHLRLLAHKGGTPESISGSVNGTGFVMDDAGLTGSTADDMSGTFAGKSKFTDQVISGEWTCS